jgi:DNA invertase Pin-like site-specific DNA recombinase
VKDLADRGIGFRSITEGLDLTTAIGRLMLTVLTGSAEFERDLIREQTAATLQAKKRRGERLGRPLSLTPSQSAAARKMLDDGESPSHVARLFRVDRSTLYRTIAKGDRIDAEAV